MPGRERVPSFQLPRGTTAERDGSYNLTTVGNIFYNTDTSNVEVYVPDNTGNSWFHLNLNNSLIPEKKIPPNQLTNSFFPLKSFKQLKSYQFPVYFKSMEQLKESGSRFIIKMPMTVYQNSTKEIISVKKLF